MAISSHFLAFSWHFLLIIGWRAWSPGPFSDFLMLEVLFSCSYRIHMVLPAKFALRFSHLFLNWFSDVLFNTKRACKSSERDPKTATNQDNPQRKSSLERTHSQERQKGSVWERSNLWNWQPLQYFQLFSKRLRGHKVKLKRQPKSRLRTPKTDKNREQKHIGK